MDDFTVYSIGLCYASVCTSLPPEEAERRMNTEIPTGTAREWSIAQEPFATGADNPCPCEQKPETHKHYLMWI